MQILPLWVPSKDWASKSRDLWSHHRRLAINGMSPTTEIIAPLNPRINWEKYEHSYQVEDLNLGGQVPPRGTQLANLWPVRKTRLLTPNSIIIRHHTLYFYNVLIDITNICNFLWILLKTKKTLSMLVTQVPRC
jgi:hypothetical protein